MMCCGSGFTAAGEDTMQRVPRKPEAACFWAVHQCVSSTAVAATGAAVTAAGGAGLGLESSSSGQPVWLAYGSISSMLRCAYAPSVVPLLCASHALLDT